MRRTSASSSPPSAGGRERLGPLGHLRAAVSGPLPALPRPVDALSERWARLAPRLRVSLLVLVVVAAVVAGEARVRAAQAEWGGEPTPVLVAEKHQAPGSEPEVRRERRPRALAPPDAVETLPSDARLALPLPEGAIVTAGHVDPAGPGAGLPPDLRAVPLPVEDAWGVVEGGRVDVWVLGGRDQASALVAGGRPVVSLQHDEDGASTALVGLTAEEVAAVTAGLASGGVLLAHAPAP